MSAYYNEHDRFASAWLRELIKAGLIAPGEVDERDIRDVRPEELTGFTQCHFFAGIGVWSYALRSAGWSDDRPVWTGSCPCQPFSTAGQRGGVADDRHLWPAWFHLIDQCRPRVVFGEQVAPKDALAWFDLVSVDLEGAGYAVGAADLCSAGFGAPHIRQRLYFVADAASEGRKARWSGEKSTGPEKIEQSGRFCQTGGLPNTMCSGQQGSGIVGRSICSEKKEDWEVNRAVYANRDSSPGPVNGFWADAEWLWCRDEKWRPAKPSIFPLAARTPNRVGLLRGAGNAITAEVAKGFIEAYLEC